MRPILILTSIFTFSSMGNAYFANDEELASPFDWDSITPSRTLEYHGCYGNTTQCARLILPLDYKNPNDTRTVAVAILKQPAVVPDSHPTFGGAIFMNPGGPGKSATDLIRNSGSVIRQAIERSGRRHYEYIGIDPRGVGRSWPVADCFPRDLFSRYMFETETRGLGPLAEGDRTVPYALALQHGFGQHCLAADSTTANGGPVMAYAGTPSVARDMVEVADQIEKLRQKAANKSAATKPSSALDGNGTQQPVARVQFIGFSYGTVLGHYLASLFPERVGRIILDGVADAQDYSTGAGWTKNLMDTDKIYAEFFEGCHQNPASCALSRTGDSSSDNIKYRFEAWLHTIQKTPATAIGPTGDVRVLTASDVRAYMGSVFYNPISGFMEMAERLDKAIRGNTTALFEVAFQRVTPPHTKAGCVLSDDYASALRDVDASLTVLCGDGDDVAGKDEAWWRQYSRQLASQSSILGSQWATIRFHCSRWPFRSNWRFTGPFTAPAPRKDSYGNPVPGYPAAPNLYLSSRLDPVTPLINARVMQSNYPASGLVIVEGAGHTAYGASAGASKCLLDAVEEYLETGHVPPETKVCQSECGPWQQNCIDRLSLAKRQVALSSQDKQHRFPLGIVWA
ncbi:hypothetical protein E4U21_003553 [Claviceps maximensis]|nr:hypothetical protein E4U21_003553 [Claviceps maximensis]